MKGLKFTILRHGSIESDYGWLLAMPNPATKTKKNPQAIWVAAPSISLLIHHPTEGYILFDTGTYPGDESCRRSPKALREFPLTIERSQFLDEQLKSLGLSIEDINIVVLSHMHWDHSNGLKFFERKTTPQRVIAPKEDYINGLVQTHSRHQVSEDCIYSKETYDLQNLNYELIEEDTTLCEGVELILLNGHTPSLLGLMLHLESGTVIYPSDAVYAIENYGPPARLPGIVYDSLGYLKAIEKLRTLEKKHEAKIIFSHDCNQIEELQTAPYFYE